MNRYLWDRIQSNEIVNCRKCKKGFSDLWQVSVNDRACPTEIYFICHFCARTEHLLKATLPRRILEPTKLTQNLT